MLLLFLLFFFILCGSKIKEPLLRLFYYVWILLQIDRNGLLFEQLHIVVRLPEGHAGDPGKLFLGRAGVVQGGDDIPSLTVGIAVKVSGPFSIQVAP